MIANFSISWRRLSNPFLFRFFSSTLQILPRNADQLSYMEVSQKFYESMKECASMRSKPVARKLHCQIITTGLVFSTFIQNHLINMYAGCELIDDAWLVFRRIQFKNVISWNMMIRGLFDSGRVTVAEELFEEMPHRDRVSWNSIMSGYFLNGLPEKTVKVFASMVQSRACVPDAYSFACVVKACANLGYLRLASQVHSLAEKFDSFGKGSVESSMVDMYIKCGASQIAERVFLKMSDPNLFSWNCMIFGYSKLYGAQRALELFDQMHERNVVSWNTMISILSQHGNAAETIDMFVEMCCQGFRPNSMTYASVLSACTSIYELRWGVHLHGRIVRTKPDIDLFVGSGLIDMYAKCGCLEKARRVFTNLKVHNVVSWTSMIGGAVHCGKEEEAILLFKQMKEVPIASDQFTVGTVLGACCGLKDIHLGGQIHAYSIRIGMDFLVPVANALVTMYAKCGDIQNAKRTFEWMSHRDVISWTAIITAFSHSRNIEKAREYFDKMPERNVITWNSMLATYVQHGLWEECLKVYVLMQQKGVKSDSITFTSSISASAHATLLNTGRQIVAQAEKLGFDSDVSVKNGIITMYARCGHIAEARKTFDSIYTKNLISWNAMMAAYAQSGKGKEVVDTFEKMLKTAITLDHITYVSVLSGCSHSGLVSQGYHYFDMMTTSHGISPTCEHFACMVDLLGRAGLVDQAKDLIDKMPLEPNADVWGALLGACRIHGKTLLAETALKNIVALDTEDCGGYLLLANLYSDSGKLESVSDVRKLMKEKGVRKNPGCSWIEVDNRVHVFTAEDSNHPRIKDIYCMLEEIIKKIEYTGMYIKEIGTVRPRDYHSEKLAMAFGLMSLPAWMPIHIMKNLRICGDCHLVMKLVSHVTSRELVVRDANRFHHFKDGSCSCQDFW